MIRRAAAVPPAATRRAAAPRRALRARTGSRTMRARRAPSGSASRRHARRVRAARARGRARGRPRRARSGRRAKRVRVGSRPVARPAVARRCVAARSRVDDAVERPVDRHTRPRAAPAPTAPAPSMRPRSASCAERVAPARPRVDATRRSQLPIACHISRSSCGPGRGPFGLPRRSSAGDDLLRADAAAGARSDRRRRASTGSTTRRGTARARMPQVRAEHAPEAARPGARRPRRRSRAGGESRPGSASAPRARASARAAARAPRARPRARGWRAAATRRDPASSAASSRRAERHRIVGALERGAQRPLVACLDACRVDDHRRGGVRRRRLARPRCRAGGTRGASGAPSCAIGTTAASVPISVSRDSSCTGSVALLELLPKRSTVRMRRQRREVVVGQRPARDHPALAAAVGRGEERERDGAIGEQLELATRERRPSHPPPCRAARGRGRRCRRRGPGSSVRAAPLPMRTPSAAPHEPVVRGAARDGELQRVARRARRGRQPPSGACQRADRPSRCARAPPPARARRR